MSQLYYQILVFVHLRLPYHRPFFFVDENLFGFRVLQELGSQECVVFPLKSTLAADLRRWLHSCSYSPVSLPVLSVRNDNAGKSGFQVHHVQKLDSVGQSPFHQSGVPVTTVSPCTSLCDNCGFLCVRVAACDPTIVGTSAWAAASYICSAAAHRRARPVAIVGRVPKLFAPVTLRRSLFSAPCF